ncbi:MULTISPECIES: molecular chaperone TorD family protein [unclassified Paenibacillus]|uniref:TorD/DmsD family molecular chaperone n=1 Tax=unclassified Paenibacillus TaxID=185978 RepID=UPI0024062EA7|nr:MULTISPECIES: molecular chaperone TorD family protein [unclassified Paenibacillus]MDF9840067.1 TorA maturation chaperone TorD [Paenibacillus sp. PastF-2]MDF9846649.1 TorA maturation chaperone TorD [Paenibacillus sp. PastM-2]MDF9853003.1 TorA maturation chaperone TorD [Paenibacillus sp. PastF-1]MDH6478493.1 TorA maturation chaperone TorD [Paenibacillus sp. PastH-2]MDH6506009.1 TorA maturation chaperone TorD [Paenibacillus sp. PastM-3]
MTIPTVPALVVPEVFSRWLESRGLIYQILVDFYGRKPTLSLVAQWRANRQMSIAAELTEGGQELKRYLCGQDPSELPQICEKEKAEYVRLMNERSASLFSAREAIQLGREQEFCNELSELYASAGIVFKKCSGEADDHISIELEFMAVMHERMLFNSFSVRSAMELLDIQVRFLEEHLLKWTPQFCSRLNAATSSPLYLGLSHMLEEFLPQDLQMLGAWRASLESSASTMA